MDSRSEISSFLTSRRAKLTPEQAGVPLYSGTRRVPGLRREEVAHLAGVSADYDARLERGKISGASREVLEALRFHRDFDNAKHNAVALLHAASAQDPYDKELIEVIGTLSTQSEEFRTLWASHDVFRHRSGAKLLTHPEVGDLELGYESFGLSTDSGLVMLVFTIEPGSPIAEAMQLLASWNAPMPHSSIDVPEH